MRGSTWTADLLPNNFVVSEEMLALGSEVSALLLRDPPKPVLISGPRGVGKSVLIHLVAVLMLKEGISAAIVTAANLKAGNEYIGMLEKAVEDLMEELREEKMLWIAPDFLDFYYAGKYQNSPSGILDIITPSLREGRIRLIGEIDDTDLEKLITRQPAVQNLFEIFRITPATQVDTLALAQRWIQEDGQPDKWREIEDAQLEELHFISRQYLSYQENPGRLLDFLKYTKDRFKNDPAPLTIDAFYAALSAQTGLPIRILNDQEKLDLDGLRAYFNSRVVGQEEAVNVLVERIAMIKAGLTDPSKPFGVFLFVGPTGTGKTEITKLLAEYLFSSAERMIRLDMSEFQSADSYGKIFGSYDALDNSVALVNEIRKTPFSVILLDEFEKAHPRIWDLFLQVFDDGRLSDSKGTTVDFRKSIIIMTSNIGAAVPASEAARRWVGFTNEPPPEMPEAYDPAENVTRTIFQTFRPEFVNRIDKIVVFNPLSRAALSKILDIELKNILQRRGLRTKQWALDMEDSAIEFLLEKGYTQNLGARPLKRAIEQYLLAPLATTIVNHNFPKGDQFLLVSKGKKDSLKVRFIDPDEPEYTWQEKIKLKEHQEQKSKSLDLRSILRDTYGSLAEFTCIKNELELLEQAYLDSGIPEKKEALLNEMARPHFWQSENKQDVLSRIEFYDRFKAAFETSKKLFERLEDPYKVRLHYDPSLLRKLAQKIYLLRASLRSYQAAEPQDALVKVAFDADQAAWGEQLITMYLEWGRRRKMSAQTVYSRQDRGKQERIFHFSGFGCYAILKAETGVHLQETKSSKSKMIEKSKVHVTVLPLDSSDYHLVDDPVRLPALFPTQADSRVVRRFNLDSKLCKDVVRKWQTGNLDKVLRGMFDVM